MSQKYHFIGIGGIGMSGLARILLSKNVSVTGSDLVTSHVTEKLIQEGAKVFIGHSAQYIPQDAHVVYNTDIKQDNPEYQAAITRKIPLLHRSDLLRELMQGYKSISVTGTHGKTTTTALLTTVLIKAGMSPSYAVGGIVTQLRSNAGYGNGTYFVAEADESDGTFLKYHSHGAIVTNIDFDHMNYFKTESNLISSFSQFINQVQNPEYLFWCGDDERLTGLRPPGTCYGFGTNCTLRACNLVQNGWQQLFDIEYNGKKYTNVALNLIGKHNVSNALAVFGLSISLGIREEDIRTAFANFEGVSRRCEKKGEVGEVLILDDYAHHPTEILATLSGIRSAIGKRRLIVAFQCHRYTRTRDCLGTFGGIFDAANHLIMTDLYTAQEPAIPGVTVDAVIKEIKQKSHSLPVHYVPRSDLTDYLINFTQHNDVVITMGAGDITRVGGEIANGLRTQCC